ncbi:hypothetical protein LJR084_004652 [Variovorax sp. LjRoot84]|uniref:hypothetical protein n=1 Tax=Variovorax sp. LjRoot84 TaxID=3342340 RepID=UPI003ECDF633
MTFSTARRFVKRPRQLVEIPLEAWRERAEEFAQISRQRVEFMRQQADMLREMWEDVGLDLTNCDAAFRGNTAAKRAWRVAAGLEAPGDPKSRPITDTMRSEAKRWARERHEFAAAEQRDQLMKVAPRHFLRSPGRTMTEQQRREKAEKAANWVLDHGLEGFAVGHGYDVAELMLDHKAQIDATVAALKAALARVPGVGRDDTEMRAALADAVLARMQEEHTRAVLDEPIGDGDDLSLVRAKQMHQQRMARLDAEMPRCRDAEMPRCPIFRQETGRRIAPQLFLATCNRTLKRAFPHLAAPGHPTAEEPLPDRVVASALVRQQDAVHDIDATADFPSVEGRG